MTVLRIQIKLELLLGKGYVAKVCLLHGSHSNLESEKNRDWTILIPDREIA